MKKVILLSVISVFFLATFVSASTEGDRPLKNTTSIQGKVFDIATGETLAGVSVCVNGSKTNVYTDLDGNFEINDVLEGNHTITVSYISYENKVVKNIELKAGAINNVEVNLSSK